MSVLAVSDLIFSDLLTELNIKPWWEKIRGYCFAAGVVSALFMTYITLSSTSINCIPKVAENTTTRKTISTTEAHFINNYCFNQLPWQVSVYGLSPLCFSIIILLISSSWTMFPDVINSFRTFAQFEEIIGNLNLTSEQLCDLSSKILTKESSDEYKEVRKACFLLWKYKSQINVERCYWIRNRILISGTIIILAFSGMMLYFLFVDKSNFYCFLELDDEFNETNKRVKQQICSHNRTKNLELFMIPFTISLLAQGVFTAVGISKFWRYPRTLWKVHDNSGRKVILRASFSNCIKPEAQYSYFMIKFWINSKPTSSGALEQLGKRMFGNSISNMEPNLEKALSEDYEMFKLYCYYGDEGYAFSVIDKVIKKETFSVESTEHANIVQCITYLRPELSHSKFRAFIDYLCEKKFWELLANVSVQCLGDWVCSEGGPSRLEINPNEIGQPYNLGRSFLYYFDEVASSDAVRTVLKPNFINECAHFDGVFMKNMFEMAGGIRLHRFEDPEKAGTLTLTKGKSSQEMIKELCKDHEKTTNNFKAKFNNSDTQTKKETRSEYNQYLEKLSEKLSRYKFDKWDHITNGLAKSAKSEKQWVLLVALLNAYMVGTRNTVMYPYMLPGCEVNEFTLINSEEKDKILPTESILYYALTKPPYLKNFLFTAVHHILGCTRGQERKVRKNDGTIVSAMDFVKENPNLELEERQKLISILESVVVGIFDEISQSSYLTFLAATSQAPSGAGKLQAPTVTSITGKSQNPTVTSIAGKSQNPTVTSIAGPSQAPAVTFQTGTTQVPAETSVQETSQTTDKTTITIDLPYADEDVPDEDDPLLPRQTSQV